MIDVKLKLLSQGARIPEYSTDGSGCFDICATRIVDNNLADNTITYGTGLAFEIPQGHVLLLFSRSGMAFNDNTRLSNCVGVIDSDYRGEVLVKLISDSVDDIGNYLHKRVVQGLVVAVPKVSFTLVDELSDTDRGVGGFGSTG